jgi:hypothetical protein
MKPSPFLFVGLMFKAPFGGRGAVLEFARYAMQDSGRKKGTVLKGQRNVVLYSGPGGFTA